MTKETLNERIAEIKSLNGLQPIFDKFIEVITELQENNKRIEERWFAYYKSDCEEQASFRKVLQEKLDEALAKVEIAKKGLEALSSCDAGQTEWISILNQCYDQLIYNKQEEKHDK